MKLVKFIDSDNQVVYIDKDQIQCIYEHKEDSLTTVRTGNFQFAVKEPIEQVLESLGYCRCKTCVFLSGQPASN